MNTLLSAIFKFCTTNQLFINTGIMRKNKIQVKESVMPKKFKCAVLLPYRHS